MTIEQQLEEARRTVTEAQMKKARLEAQLENAQERKQEYLDSCKAKGLKPEELDGHINVLQAKINEDLSALNERLKGSGEEPADRTFVGGSSDNREKAPSLNDLPF